MVLKNGAKIMCISDMTKPQGIFFQAILIFLNTNCHELFMNEKMKNGFNEDGAAR